ncbi:lipopolysaccharide kinase InaA family protein [Flavobacterium lacus]|uniref:Lipopolysaccharide kinase (Kdo/WaaP) family protein n=1 Tax=Flavobacterium lacus TaxID=1353778 RepID=A0A328WXG8_9FLAO|nr:lipopolysaccharide kinase InaA family protein [Flavobacterium lacus]RAR50981.1 lipopolysaccharide kinase (Kdo/WaaP) family protein [Flavobacterium lacus]
MKSSFFIQQNVDKEKIIDIIQYFNQKGKLFDDRKRNKIKLFEFNEITINVKSFKIPNLFNKIIYRYFRKSKARRSFEFANKLLENKIGTPQPIAYFENFDWLGLKDSYYVSEHLNCDLTYRELVEVPNYPDRETILRQFTRFSYLLHQKGIEFLDHSPGNTLIKKENNANYSFYLVDLNRMKFHKTLDFQSRMKNLSRLTPQKEMIAIMSNEYAKLSGEDENTVFETMWKYTEDFQYGFHRKKRIKKKLKFWKK